MKDERAPVAGPNRERPHSGEPTLAAGRSPPRAKVIALAERGRARDEKVLSQIPVLRPEDTGTRLALKEEERGGEPVWFAVQLDWSAQEIDLGATPRDPIFSSYNVYTTRARRDGREWYELRLGFFRDAISAKQVASYLRSQFSSAAVVPVSPQEQAAARALRKSGKAAAAAPPAAEAAPGSHATPVAHTRSDESATATSTRGEAFRPRALLRWWSR